MCYPGYPFFCWALLYAVGLVFPRLRNPRHPRVLQFPLSIRNVVLYRLQSMLRVAAYLSYFFQGQSLHVMHLYRLTAQDSYR